MGLPTLNKFLFCCELETGGLVLGWLSAIISAIGILSFGILMIFSIVALGSYDGADKESAQTALIILIVVSVIYLLYLCVLCYASINLIRGTKNKNHTQMKLYLILMAIGVILSFIQIFTSGVNGIASAIISAIIAAYFFMCIYSLYVKVKGSGTF